MALTQSSSIEQDVDRGNPGRRRWSLFPKGVRLWHFIVLPAVGMGLAILVFRVADRWILVNLDPGYLDLGKLVLASCKEAPDKLYLGEGVWGHTCLRYRFGAFSAPDHSFPDFQDGRFNSFFTEARGLYKSMLQERRP